MTDVSKLNKLIEIIQAIPQEERNRYINAAMTFLGSEVALAPGAQSGPSERAEIANHPHHVAEKIRRHSLAADQIEQTFHFHEDGSFGIIAVPGKSKKEKAINTYVLLGLGTYLATGKLEFADGTAREMCKAHGCYDAANHSTYLKSKHPAFISKGSDWALTIPGIKEAAALVKEVADTASKG